jgi:hypothetical protein
MSVSSELLLEGLAGGFRRCPVCRCPLVRVADCLGGFGRHVVLVVFGEHFAGGEDVVVAESALCDDAFAFAEEVISLSVSVTTKRRVTPSGWRCSEPSLTMPPMRKLLPFGASPAATWVGEKKNTRLLWKGVEHQCGDQAENRQPADDQRDAFVTWFQALLLRGVSEGLRRSSERSARCWRLRRAISFFRLCRSSNGSASINKAITATDPQT